jgi:anti-sigma factor RsiW
MDVSGLGHAGDRLSALLDDELGDREALAVARHLARCDGCLAELERLRATRTQLRELSAPAPSLGWMVETMVLGAVDDPAPVRGAAGRPVALIGGVAGVLFALALALGGGPEGSVVPPVDRFVVDHVTQVDGGPVVTPARLDGRAGP